jgi:hypothetical protein
LVRCSLRTAKKVSLLLGILVVALVGGCSEPTLKVPPRTFSAPDEAFWSYQKAARDRDYAEVFSYLSADQRDTLGELFWWLQRYTQNGKETLRALGCLDSLPVGERYVACFAIAGISPLHEESVAIENLHRDAVRMKWDESRHCYVFECRSSPNVWREDPDIEVITKGDGRKAIRLNYLWAGSEGTGSRIRREMIAACKEAIRMQDEIIKSQDGSSDRSLRVPRPSAPQTSQLPRP